MGVVKGNYREIARYVFDSYKSLELMKELDPDIVQYQCRVVDDVTRSIKQVNKLCWPFWDRELVYQQELVETDNRIYIVMYSVESPEENENVVRAKLVVSGYVFSPHTNGTHVYRLAQIDPCGNIPASLTKSYGEKTTSMIKHLEKLKI